MVLVRGVGTTEVDGKPKRNPNYWTLAKVLVASIDGIAQNLELSTEEFQYFEDDTRPNLTNTVKELGVWQVLCFEQSEAAVAAAKWVAGGKRFEDINLLRATMKIAILRYLELQDKEAAFFTLALALASICSFSDFNSDGFNGSPRSLN